MNKRRKKKNQVIRVKELKKVNLKENDVIILDMGNEDKITNARAEYISGLLEEIFPNNKSLILANGKSIKVIGEEEKE